MTVLYFEQSLISSYSRLFSWPLRNILRVLTIIGITITFIFLHFFFSSSLTKSKYLFSFSLFFILTIWSPRMVKIYCWWVLFFLSLKTRSGYLVGFVDPCVIQSLREFYASLYLGEILVCTNTIWRCLWCNPIYQPLRSGRIWHKANF